MFYLKNILLLVLVSCSSALFGQLSDGGLPLEINNLKSTFLAKKVVRMPHFEIPDETALQKTKESMLTKSIQYAHTFKVNLTPENSGVWSEQGNKKIWQLQIESDGAKSIGLIFSTYHLPENARLFVFDPEKENIYGAFTSLNNKPYKKLAIYPLPGEVMMVQYEEPFDALFQGELEIGFVNHDYIGVVDLKNRFKKRPSGLCNVDINCESGINSETIQQSVCRIFSGGELGTGTLINNTQEDGQPLVISAFHVYEKEDVKEDIDSMAQITVYDFNYESPFCTGIDGFDLQTISGSKLLASFDSLDFILVALSEMPPPSYRPYYSGWDVSGTIPSNSSTIHHPNGDVKKISHDDGTCDSLSFSGNFLPFGHWEVLNWESGTTENGSSGSALFGQGNRVFGTLSGGAATCSNIAYDAFARLNKMWNYRTEPEHQLKHWLDPMNKGVSSINGMNPYEAESLSCTMISNFLTEDELALTSDQLVNLSVSEVAERFNQTTLASLTGVAIGIKAFEAKSANPEITIHIYTGDAYPDFDEKQYKFPMKKLTANAMNYFSFGESIELESNFFISVVLEDKLDKVTLYQSGIKNIVTSNSMLVNENGSWKYFSEYNANQQGASLLIQANVCGASFQQNNDSLDDENRLMKYYPNPAQNYVVVEFLDREAENELSFFDMTGRLIFNENYHSRSYAEIDLSAFNPGIYLLNIRAGQQSETKKIVIH